jgi:hypothetical protein
VGAAFLVLAAVTWWRGHHRVSATMGSVGGTLLVAGMVVPGKLDPVYRAWMGLAHAISRVTTPILMGVVYFIVLAPIAFVMRVFGYDPLRQRRRASSGWQSREPDARRGDLSRQF